MAGNDETTAKKQSSPAKSLANFLGFSNHGTSSVSQEKQKKQEWEEKLGKAEQTKIDSSHHSFDSQESFILKAMEEASSVKTPDAPSKETPMHSPPVEVKDKDPADQSIVKDAEVSPRNGSSEEVKEDKADDASAVSVEIAPTEASIEKQVVDEKPEDANTEEAAEDVRQAAKELLETGNEEKLAAVRTSSRPSRSFEKQQSGRRRSRSFNRRPARDRSKTSEQPQQPRRQRSKVERDAKRA